jgi:Tfp pilus assembly protein PilF
VSASRAGLLLFGLVLACGGDEAARDAGKPRFVGSAACAGCHATETELWRGSHHDLAMDVATAATVLGDFDGARFEHLGVTTSFRRTSGTGENGERFLVTTEGPDGALHEYTVSHVFGVEPLQQYLVPFEGGRVQALGVAWDSRPADAGGQRWFHLYPDERIPPDDVLHWTGVQQRWNYMCAECHSTDLRRGYDAARDSYSTTWAEIDVACEACHGPGSAHVAWAEAGARGVAQDADPRLAIRLEDHDGGRWEMDPATGIARRSVARAAPTEVEACARCHSRRTPIAGEYEHGRPLLDTHVPALLEEPLYHADGQIQEEVYEWGSFVQSRMYAAGVRCSDCHDPHSLAPRYGGGNTLCAQCHAPERFDTPEHHHHAPDSAGARCIECHMPQRTYMVVDPRRDHSMRVPRPDLSLALGTPNACNDCHTDQGAAWAAAAAETWYGKPEARPGDWAQALHAGRAGGPGAEAALAGLAQDGAAPAIARATALVLLRERLGQAGLTAIALALRDPEGLVRRAAASALVAVDPRLRPALAAPLLEDALLGVRAEAARSLAAVPEESLPAALRPKLASALAEYVETQEANADRAESWMNLGVLAFERGDFPAAERAYRTALARDQRFVAAYVNLADLFRAQGRDADGERELRAALVLAPRDADVHHALGLVLVRLGQRDKALVELRQATELAPDVLRFGYVHAVARHDAGERERALFELESLHARHPNAREVLEALALYAQEAGQREAARAWAEKLVALDPGDASAQALLAQLGGAGN